MITYQEFKRNLDAVQKQVESACSLVGRKASEVTILPVTKNHPVEAIQYVQNSNYKSVGENRVQEAVLKKESFASSMDWELIGHLQSNKVKLAVANFDRIQSVDSLKIAKKIQEVAKSLGKEQRILLQVNTGKDPAKYGFMEEEVTDVFCEIYGCSHLRVEGLMNIAPLSDDKKVTINTFHKLADLQSQLEVLKKCKLPELSMGMSGDLVEAIAAGSTMIRVGTGLFGARPL